MDNKSVSHVDLQAIAKQVMLENGFEPEFPAPAQQQLSQLQAHPPRVAADGNIRDLRNLLWSSIDNDTSRDLDQIEFAERQPDGQTKVLVGIADVDAFVPKSSPIDGHAAKETTTVYTGVRNFPMLPEQLSTGVTSLLENQDNLSIVIEFLVDQNGCVSAGNAYPAIVRNKAQLTYNAVGAWLEGKSAAPPKVAASAELQAQLKLQNEVAQALKNERFRHGALNIETTEVHPVMLNEQVVDIARQEKNLATELIEDFMIAANGVVARMLEQVSSIRRVVKTPERWNRIVELAAQSGEKLPSQPDSKALNDFLMKRKAADPDHFADVSLAVIKLMGPGEYVLERPGDPAQGHFGLAVQDYTHSTAPNRRFADVVTQRLIKAMQTKQTAPYSDDELTAIANNCTQKEDAARKVERGMTKRIAAVAMSHRIGESFDAIVTGVTPHGTFVRVLQPHVEGLLCRGEQGVDVGDKLRVKLISTDAQKGYIDFARG
ncbi:MAG TPA: RNB domain-containing ribonuclease [Terriglobales bacterium]|jgi:VacB/RNase II family 3'-5' exoribonuclease|nr:RNB domain-containing ribonuclease [Terriglobales bacterium]